MKILLTTLNAKYVHSNLAIRYLYSAGRRAGLTADQLFMEEFTINNEASYIYGEILRGEYDLVCFSCYIWNIEMTRQLCSDLKKARPGMLILLGGPEVSFEAASFMKENTWADMILRGEGEDSFARLCTDLTVSEAGASAEKDGGKSLLIEGKKIPGLIWREEGEICQTPENPAGPMEQMPFPYVFTAPERDKVTYYESSRGCPYRCSYCLSSLEKSVRPLPLSRTLRELDFFLEQKVMQVKFIDRTFNYDKQRAKAIWAHLASNDNGVTNFHFEICGELLDEECFRLLAGARKGLFQFEIGIQSCNPHTLAAVNRNPETAAVLENVRRLTALGNSHIHVDLIAGLPFEDYESFGRSFDQVYALGANNLQLGFLKLLKGTGIRREAGKNGYVWRDRPPYEVISSRWLGAEELVRLSMIEHVLELYSNKGGFRHTLAALEGAFGRPFVLFESLAEFFYEKGFQHRPHRKEDLYRILRLFICSRNEEFLEAAAAEELLKKDLEETMNFDAVKKFYKKGWEI